MRFLDVVIELVVGDRDVGGLLELLLHIGDLGLVDVDLQIIDKNEDFVEKYLRLNI